MKRNDIVAAGLSAAVVAGLLYVRHSTLVAQGATRPSNPSDRLGPTAEQTALTTARGLIRTVRGQLTNLNDPTAREGLARSLELAADGYATTSDRAASELRAAAVDIRAGRTPAEPPTLAPSRIDAANDTVDTSALLRKADAFVRGVTGVTMDEVTLAALDNLAFRLASYQPEAARKLVDAASRVYDKLGMQRPVAMRL